MAEPAASVANGEAGSHVRSSEAAPSPPPSLPPSSSGSSSSSSSPPLDGPPLPQPTCQPRELEGDEDTAAKRRRLEAMEEEEECHPGQQEKGSSTAAAFHPLLNSRIPAAAEEEEKWSSTAAAFHPLLNSRKYAQHKFDVCEVFCSTSLMPMTKNMGLRGDGLSSAMRLSQWRQSKHGSGETDLDLWSCHRFLGNSLEQPKWLNFSRSLEACTSSWERRT